MDTNEKQIQSVYYSQAKQYYVDLSIKTRMDKFIEFYSTCDIRKSTMKTFSIVLRTDEYALRKMEFYWIVKCLIKKKAFSKRSM